MSAEAASLDCGEILYRAVLRKSQLDITKRPPRPTADNFMCRPEQDDDGLSVGIASRLSPAEFAARFTKCHAIVSIHTGHLRDLGLRIIVDPEDDTHALIQGLPDREARKNDAETIARSILGSVRPVDMSGD